MKIPVFNRCSEVEQWLTERLQLITKANGYDTDIGLQHVFRGKRKVSDPDIPCAVILTGEDRAADTGSRGDVLVDQDFVLGGYAECDPAHPNDTAYKIVRDIKRAIWPDDTLWQISNRVLKYRGKDIGPRADGAPVVFAVVHITVSFAERLSDA